MGVLGRRQQAAGVAVQTSQWAKGVGFPFFLIVTHHGSRQGRLRFPRRRMNRQIGGLVHHQQAAVLVHHLQRILHWLHPHRIFRQAQHQGLSRLHIVDGAQRLQLSAVWLQHPGAGLEALAQRRAIRQDAVLHLAEPGQHAGGETAAPAQKGLDGGAVVFHRDQKGQLIHEQAPFQTERRRRPPRGAAVRKSSVRQAYLSTGTTQPKGSAIRPFWISVRVL